jgi:GNAT superfamily N-acetyltransferase
MVDIRFATESDAGIILGFIRGLAEYEREPSAVKVSEATLRAQLSSERPPFECLIAEDSGAPAGFALFFHTYSTWLGKRGVWLEDLFVLPEKRRLGIGRLLLQRVAAVAAERDCGRFEWSVLDWNESAIAFYKSLGAKLMDEWTICRVDGSALQALGASTAGPLP